MPGGSGNFAWFMSRRTAATSPPVRANFGFTWKRTIQSKTWARRLGMLYSMARAISDQ